MRWANPLGPRSTKMPDLGMSRVRSVIAVTRPFLRLKTDVWKLLFRSLIEIATLGGGGLPFSRLP